MKTTSTDAWRQLQPGEPLQPGDGFLHPDFNEWLDYRCRPDIFVAAERQAHGITSQLAT